MMQLRTNPPSTLDAPFHVPLQCVMDIPFPTSTNRLWTMAGRRMILSAEYRTWKKQAGLAVIENGSWRNRVAMPGHFMALVMLDSARRVTSKGRAKDADNHAKACLDFAQSMGLVSDDALCDEITVRWVPTHEAPTGCRLKLTSVA